MHNRPSIGSASALSARDRALRGAVALLALLLPFMISQPNASALASGVEQRAVFNDPTITNVPSHPNNDYVIIKEHVNAINGAPAGAVIRISTWRWTIKEVTNAVDAAVKRGVDVKIALNSASAEYSETQRLKSLLGSRVTYCGKGFGNGACTSSRDGGTQHVKVMTVSESNGKKGLVFSTSSNLSWGQVGGSFNDLLITSGDADCYRKVTNYLDDAVTQRQRGPNYRGTSEGHFTCPGSQQEWWLGPEASEGGSMDEEFRTDSRAKVLNGIVGGSGCVVYNLQSKIDDTRTPVVRQYQDAKANKCFVSAITRMKDSSEADDSRARFAASNIPWKTHIKSTTSSTTRHNHSKVDIVRDPNGPDYVLSGSENETRDHRRNDEVLVKSSNLNTILAYEDWYENLAKRAGVPIAP